MIQPKIPETDQEVRELMHKELWALEQQIPTSKAVCTILIDEEGGVHYFSTYAKGGKFPLLAGITLAQFNISKDIAGNFVQELES